MQCSPKPLAKLLLGALLSAASSAFAADFIVIANAPIPLSAAEIKEIFLGEVQFVGSTKMAPIDNASVQVDFLTRIVGLPEVRYRALWAKKSFRDAQNAPAMKNSDAEVIALVKSQPGSIGYVTHAPSGVYIVGRY